MNALNPVLASGRTTQPPLLPPLLPSQRDSFDALKAAVAASPIVGMVGSPGMGRTTLLRHLAHERDGMFLDMYGVSRIVRNCAMDRSPEVVWNAIAEGLRHTGTVIFDGCLELASTSYSLGPGVGRGPYFRVLMPSLRESAIHEDHRLILGGNEVHFAEGALSVFGPATTWIEMERLRVEDYRELFERELGPQAASLDFSLLFRSAPMLDLYQLSFWINLLKGAPSLTTAEALSCLEREVLHSNLHIQEVEQLSFDSLPGSEHIAQALETHVVLPFEHKEKAAELGLKPKRGVLLYGPPGTGKTSIGRALAHRIAGRFFLIDGSFVTEPPNAFFAMVGAVVGEAKANAPSVLFIDDADVLFEIEHIAGLSRYLLSLLDGLESETAGNVCVMMTAMDARKVPEALLRSGRVELWLETRAPDEATRARILQRWMVSDMPDHESVDHAALAAQTEGFTPADLRRLAGDAKLLYAADVVAGATPRSAHDYLAAAVADLIALRTTMAEQLADDSLRTRTYA